MSNKTVVSFLAALVLGFVHLAQAQPAKVFRIGVVQNLPVESLSRLELAVNLRTARELGLTIPQSVLFRADKVIE